jgi:hypothetical protein
MLGMIFCASPTSFADRNAVSATFIFKEDVRTFPVTDLCGVDYDVTETVNAVFHITDNLSTPNPVDHFTTTETGTVTLVPVDPSLPTYTGRVTFWAGGNTNPNSDGGTVTLNLRLTGSDGSTLRVHETFHFTVVNGDLVVFFDKITCD